MWCHPRCGFTFPFAVLFGQPLVLFTRSHKAFPIAEALKISENTVQFHKKNIYNKTNCETLVGLVKYAIRTGIVIP
ncbi:MAG: helix-turn-helix domain-containing protein [Bacteroidetes bacterium]|nr:helix-turn-helix domain-containing protein [Bacteroidota bacterium]